MPPACKKTGKKTPTSAPKSSFCWRIRVNAGCFFDVVAANHATAMRQARRLCRELIDHEGTDVSGLPAERHGRYYVDDDARPEIADCLPVSARRTQSRKRNQ